MCPSTSSTRLPYWKLLSHLKVHKHREIANFLNIKTMGHKTFGATWKRHFHFNNINADKSHAWHVQALSTVVLEYIRLPDFEAWAFLSNIKNYLRKLKTESKEIYNKVPYLKQKIPIIRWLSAQLILVQ